MLEIGKRPSAERQFEQPFSNQAPEGAFDRDHAHGLAAKDGLGEHRNAVGRDVDFVAVAQQRAEPGECIDESILLSGHERLKQVAGAWPGPGAGCHDQAS